MVWVFGENFVHSGEFSLHGNMAALLNTPNGMPIMPEKDSMKVRVYVIVAKYLIKAY